MPAAAFQAAALRPGRRRRAGPPSCSTRPPAADCSAASLFALIFRRHRRPRWSTSAMCRAVRHRRRTSRSPTRRAAAARCAPTSSTATARCSPTNLDSPSLYADPEEIHDRGDAAPTSAARALPGARSRRGCSRQARLGQELCLDLKRQLTPRQEYAVNISAFRGSNSSTRSAASIRSAICCRTWSAIAGSTITARPASSAASTAAMQGQRRAGAAVARRALQFILTDELQQVITSSTPRAPPASSWTSTPARSWRWCRCRISIPTIRRHTIRSRTGRTMDRIFNRITLGDYEIGSVFKIFNTAMALDSRRRDDDRRLRRAATRSRSAASRSRTTTASTAC